MCPFWLPIFLSFLKLNKPGLGGTGIDPGLTSTSFPSSIGKDEFRTHDLTIVSLVRYPLDRTFALKLTDIGQLSLSPFWAFANLTNSLKKAECKRCFPPRTIGSSYSNCRRSISGSPFTNTARAVSVHGRGDVVSGDDDSDDDITICLEK